MIIHGDQLYFEKLGLTFERLINESICKRPKQQKKKQKEHEMSIENTLERIATALEAIAKTDQWGYPVDAKQPAGEPSRKAIATLATPAMGSPFDHPQDLPAPEKPAAPSKRGRPAKDPAPVAENPAVTKDELMELVRAFVAQKGSQTRAKEILADYGAGRVAELDAKHYAEVSEKLKAEMK